MIHDLEFLIKLQEIDLRIKEQENAQEEFPAAVSELKSEISKTEDKLISSQEQLDNAIKGKSAIGEQIAAAKASLEKSQERLSFIKTNREYDAVHHEIESQKNNLTTAENKLRSSDNEIELLSTSVESAKEQLSEIKSENEPKISQLQEKIDAIDSVIATFTEEREKVVPEISKQILRVYDNIRKKRKNGRALSLIGNSRNCTVCYKILEPQLFNEIKRGAKVLLCESCGSILLKDPGVGE